MWKLNSGILCRILDVNKERAIEEWRHTKLLIMDINDKTTKLNVSSDLKSCTVLKDILTVLVTVPPSNAHVEHLFSAMKILLRGEEENIRQLFIQKIVKIYIMNIYSYKLYTFVMGRFYKILL